MEEKIKFERENMRTLVTQQKKALDQLESSRKLCDEVEAQQRKIKTSAEVEREEMKVAKKNTQQKLASARCDMACAQYSCIVHMNTL